MRSIKHGIHIKKHVLWLLALALLSITKVVMASSATQITAETVIVMNKYGIGAPFLISWTPIWIFSLAGGIGAIFIKIPGIDKHFVSLAFAKPFLGLFGGIALCLFVSDGSEPPEVALSAYAFAASLLSAPILQTLMVVATIPKNQAGLINSINPFKFKIVVADDDSKEPRNGGDNQ